ncbi:hypothetical protein R4B61_03055 [Fructilactobacillus vespulae]|uniref:hypothetical protein n=1 Tax=Fructilactobacillus vespulae TaxID=1249630 RepID=UPI0039B4C1AD
MIKKLKLIFKKSNLIITIPTIVIVLLVAANAYLFIEIKNTRAQITTTEENFNKVSKEFSTKYQKTEEEAKKEFRETHKDPLNDTD